MLYIIATPIGNREDITLRALRVLEEVNCILAEDTRKTGALLNHFNIKNKLISFYEHNENRKKSQIINELERGKNIALVSSAGTPTISDPGFKLIREAREKNIEVTSLPGPSSIITAISSSSISSNEFTFFGYLPRKKTARLRFFSRILNWPTACVFFESPYRIIRTLGELEEVLGDRKITVCRELTKKFEEVFESNLKEAVEHFSKKKPKGEITLVLAPA
ncbi:MAG: 16S rRNA (cytidine(1402)-2'-O)-methyltransferase [Candidatus Omnitrophica bacterium]|nr:16S rRNA (cytidine(1402)-2'-O)-methyltransferase [Candidatus Omnitrophota bacterium]MCF7893699.1 16S rRNA (cytidine(1402)-2'-O)-methyltransferase [Candidatus Omnitrophota bacterium]